MLPICLDEATKVAGDVLEGRKCYRFEVTLGRRTATGDAEGEVVETRPVPQLARSAVEEVVAAFVGERQQVPPMYSALKRDGQPLYRLARAGIEVEREARAIRIDRLELHGIADDRLELEMLCSRGTYVRTVAEEIATVLGTCGFVSSLRREYVEPFPAKEMVTLDSVLTGAPPPLLSADSALEHLPAVRLGAADADRVRHGQPVQAEASHEPERCRLYDERGRFFGIGERAAEGLVRPRRLLNLPL
jgi:tRNA pseudouridine55 synthase